MHVRVRFSQPVARLATETEWHPTQQVEPADLRAAVLKVGESIVERYGDPSAQEDGP